MSTDRNVKTDKELWQSLAPAPVASTAVSDMDFAAWLEGRLSETASARIEAAVAADPEMRAAAMDLADILGKPLPAAPARMAVRAQALVGFEVERQGSRRGWFGSLFDGIGWPRAAMATAAVMVAVSGFLMGGGLGESFAFFTGDGI
jgi:anti-sigma factor RsiW